MCGVPEANLVAATAMLCISIHNIIIIIIRRPGLPAKPRPMPPRRAPPLVSPDLLLKPSAQNAAMAKNKAATTAAWYKIST